MNNPKDLKFVLDGVNVTEFNKIFGLENSIWIKDILRFQFDNYNELEQNLNMIRVVDYTNFLKYFWIENHLIYLENLTTFKRL